ncbi:MAG: hypothetical protein WBV23_00435 [Desulfobaccales bacterium]
MGRMVFPGQYRLPGESEANQEPFKLFGWLMVLLAFEQPVVEDQQISITASPTEVMLAAGYAAHPGFTPDSG